eukprot:760124-Hanusia_phi.AAC.1
MTPLGVCEALRRPSRTKISDVTAGMRSTVRCQVNHWHAAGDRQKLETSGELSLEAERSSRMISVVSSSTTR